MARLPDGWIVLVDDSRIKIRQDENTISIPTIYKELVMCKHCLWRNDEGFCTYLLGKTQDNFFCAMGEMTIAQKHAEQEGKA